MNTPVTLIPVDIVARLAGSTYFSYFITINYRTVAADSLTERTDQLPACRVARDIECVAQMTRMERWHSFVTRPPVRSHDERRASGSAIVHRAPPVLQLLFPEPSHRLHDTRYSLH